MRFDVSLLELSMEKRRLVLRVPDVGLLRLLNFSQCRRYQILEQMGTLSL